MKFEDEITQWSQQCRGISSRHLDIPPTPRDTMAVLRQAAEQQRELEAGISWWARIRPMAYAACALAVMVGLGVMQLRPTAPDLVENNAYVTDIGLDLVDWDLEIDSLMGEINQSIASLSVHDADWINESILDWSGNGDSWL